MAPSAFLSKDHDALGCLVWIGASGHPPRERL
jgi:hypothetical protein